MILYFYTSFWFLYWGITTLSEGSKYVFHNCILHISGMNLLTNSVKNQLCFRSDGLFVKMEGVAMVFQSTLTEQDEGLYTCQASFYHHTATVIIQVEVTSEEKLFGNVVFSFYISNIAGGNVCKRCDNNNMLRYDYEVCWDICVIFCVLCVLQHWWPWSASLLPQQSFSSSLSFSGCSGKLNVSTGDMLQLGWGCVEGQHCWCHMIRDKQDVQIVNQLTKTSVPCSYSQTGSIVAEADRCLCHRSPTCRQVENVPSVSHNNRFIFQFPGLPFSSVSSGYFSSRLLLFGPLSPMPHCKSKGKRFKKSTLLEVISTMKFKLLFVNEKIHESIS